ncbi:polysaccharide biosynthesis/export family protein [Sphingomonas sp. R86520]|uniref:polysaccharide biosynthesis/export family protein n=1 Tax=Sphingomonas sp. R86520 TaxID=3093859 RepID=UPI0036D289EF
MLLASCASQRDRQLSYNPKNFTAPDALAMSDTLTTYQAGPGDVISITIFNVESMSGDHQIDAAGNITMPLIGAVPVAGKSTQEIGTDLTARLNTRYLQRPQVTVSLKTAVARTVTIDGSVASPGLYPIPDKTTLLKTIAMARGTSQGANPKKVVVFRQINGQRNAAAFDLTTIRNGTDPDPVIYANDIVVVDGRQTNPAWTTLLQTVPLIGLFTRF